MLYTLIYDYIVSFVPYFEACPFYERFAFKMKLKYKNNCAIKSIIEGELYYCENQPLENKKDNLYKEIIVFLYAGNKLSRDFLSNENKVKKNLEPIYKVYVINKSLYASLGEEVLKHIKKHNLSFHISSMNLAKLTELKGNYRQYKDVDKGEIKKKMSNATFYNEEYNIEFLQRVSLQKNDKKAIEEKAIEEKAIEDNVIVPLITIATKYKFIEDFLFYSNLTDLHYHLSFSRGWRAFRDLFFRRWISYMVYIILLITVGLSWTKHLNKIAVTFNFIQAFPTTVKEILKFIPNGIKFSISHGIMLYLLASIFGIYIVKGIKNAKYTEVKKAKLLFLENAQNRVEFNDASGDFVYFKRHNNEDEFEYITSIVDLLKAYELNLIKYIVNKGRNESDNFNSLVYNTLFEEVVRQFLSTSEKLPLINI